MFTVNATVFFGGDGGWWHFYGTKIGTLTVSVNKALESTNSIPLLFKTEIINIFVSLEVSNSSMVNTVQFYGPSIEQSPHSKFTNVDTV